MNGAEFLIPLAFVGVILAGFTAILGISRKRITWDEPERIGLRLALELAIFTTCFALLPFPLSYLVNEPFAWRMGSMALALFLGFQITRVYQGSRRYSAQWPVVMVSLLALSAFFLTIEFINGIVWNSLAVYAAGLMWLLTTAGLQFIAFVIYDRENPVSAGASAGGRPVGGLRRSSTTRHSNYTPNADPFADSYRAGAARAGRDANGHAHGRPRADHRRTDTHTAVRPNPDDFGRRSDGNARF